MGFWPASTIIRAFSSRNEAPAWIIPLLTCFQKLPPSDWRLFDTLRFSAYIRYACTNMHTGRYSTDSSLSVFLGLLYFYSGTLSSSEYSKQRFMRLDISGKSRCNSRTQQNATCTSAKHSSILAVQLQCQRPMD